MERNHRSIPIATVRTSKHRFAMTMCHQDVNERRKAHEVGRLYSPSEAKGRHSYGKQSSEWRYNGGENPNNTDVCTSFWLCCCM